MRIGEAQLMVADRDHVAVLQRVLLDELAVDVGAVRAVEILEKRVVENVDDQRVMTADCSVVDANIVIRQAAEQEPDEFEKTMIITPGSAMATKAAQKASDAVPSKPTAAGLAAIARAHGENPVALPKAKLQVLSGAFAGRELELTKALTTLGRPGVQVAAITRRADGYSLVHVDGGSDNSYPQVNGKQIGEQACKLKDNDVIQLAGVKMGFYQA